MEIDSIRNQLLREMDGFFQNHSDTLVPQSELPSGYKLAGERCTRDKQCASRNCKANKVIDLLGGSCQGTGSDWQFVSGAPSSRVSFPPLTFMALLAALVAVPM